MKTIPQFFVKSLMVATFAVAGSFSLHTMPTAQAAASSAQNLQLRLGNGRIVYFEYLKAAKKGAATFLLMPGVNRSLLMSEDGAQALAKKGYGVATMNFSVQPFSVNELEKNEIPFFMNQSPTLKDLALEVEALAKDLQQQLQAETVIPVSLSYSGAVSPFLKNFPLVIDTVPLTSSAAQNPELEQYRQSLKLGEMWNPIFGPGITRSLLDQAYRSKWADQVDSLSKQFNLASDRRSQMIEGYTTLSRATEGFEWDVAQLPAKTRRVFMFAGNEGKGLLEHQVRTFLKVYSADPKSLLFVVKDSGHLIPGDQPESYAGVLDLVAQGKTLEMGGVVEVDPSTRKSRTFQGAQAQKYLIDLVSAKEN